RISYNPRKSLFAQVRSDTFNPRVGSYSTLSATITLDEAAASLDLKPALIKIDVEGFEPHVLRGATKLLTDKERPGICLEWNPVTSSEVGSCLSDIPEMLVNYEFYYIDDF